MLKVELKRILKTRSTWRLLAIAFVLCLFFGFYAIQRVFYDERVFDSVTGQVVQEGRLTYGAEAYEILREENSHLKGEVKPELFSEAVRLENELIAEYGDARSIPTDIEKNVLGPYSRVFTWLVRAFVDENGMMSTNTGNITPDKAQNFYRERLSSLERQLANKYAEQPLVADYAMSRADHGGNFNYSYGIGSSYAFDHLGICVFMVILICVIITAPIFSSDYSSGGDNILRCTRHGRTHMALVKLGSAMIISVGAFIICIGTFLAIMYLAFGFDDITSLELLSVAFAYNPNSLTAMGCMGLILLSGFLTMLAMSCFTLFLSSRLSSPVAVLAGSTAVIIIPTVIELTNADGNVLNWIRFCLPSGGTILSMTSFFNELGNLRFLWLGDFITWSPYVMLAAAAVQIPIWLLLAIRSYNRHQAA